MNIIKYDIEKNTCNNNTKNKYSINEPKGILLGLILYFCKNQKILDKKNIRINSNKYKEDLEYLFPNLIFVTTNSNFDICIKTKILGDINICNLEYIDKIKSDKVYLLPYYDNDNPIIMYELNPKNKIKQDIDKIKNKINQINNCYDNSNIENKILKYYLELNGPFNNNLKDLIDYINQISGNIIYKEKIITKKVNVSIPTPYLVPVPMIQNSSVTEKKIEELKDIIKKNKILAKKEIDEKTDLNKIIDELKSALETVNNGLELESSLSSKNKQQKLKGGGHLGCNNINLRKLIKLYNKMFMIKQKNR